MLLLGRNLSKTNIAIDQCVFYTLLCLIYFKNYFKVGNKALVICYLKSVYKVME
uniref:Uncharacterized protein n=1 Tax=Heterorhabditis bacteriophora TaxID=37862 RepID=A0A1I7X2G1_HETBA